MATNDKFERFNFGTVKVGERGQVVIPVELRESMKIKPGDHLVVLSKHGKAIVLLKTEDLEKVLNRFTEKIDNFREKLK